MEMKKRKGDKGKEERKNERHWRKNERYWRE